MEKFVALYDVHFGYERRNGHRAPLHDSKAIKVALDFIKEFKPDHVILGGDILDCGCISHHNHGKPGAVEGFRLLADAQEARVAIINPIEELKTKSLTYIVGNHEDWLTDLVDQIPALEGIVDVRSLLKLKKAWKIVEQGESHRLGKLIFIHGDQIRGGDAIAKNATLAYEKNVRLGHYHTFQAYTKTSAVESNGHTGIAVPCLCKKSPRYNNGSPNKWMQGFLWGYVNGPEGGFSDYVTVIVNGRAIINGKPYGR
jgi:hypothetical protein